MPPTLIDAIPLFAGRRLLAEAGRLAAVAGDAQARIDRVRPALAAIHAAAVRAGERLCRVLPHLREAQAALDSGGLAAMERARDRLGAHLPRSL